MTTEPRTIVLITGANQGIGYAVAQGLLVHKNYFILLGSRDASRGVKAATELDPTGEWVQSITIDVADDASVQQAADLVESKYGRLDVLINNTGINNEIDIVIEQHEKQQEGGLSQREKVDLAQQRKLFRDVYEVNVFGAAMVTEAFTPLLENQPLPQRGLSLCLHTRAPWVCELILRAQNTQSGRVLLSRSTAVARQP